VRNLSAVGLSIGAGQLQQVRAQIREASAFKVAVLQQPLVQSPRQSDGDALRGALHRVWS
jgi:hypothetical protein